MLQNLPLKLTAVFILFVKSKIVPCSCQATSRYSGKSQLLAFIPKILLKTKAPRQQLVTQE